MSTQLCKSGGKHVRQLINGKLYDTENSTKLASWSNGYPSESDLWIEETLYKTAEGDYFICGEGGTVTPYSKRNGERHAGSAIRPLTRNEAVEWAAIHKEKDLLETEFQNM
jgi:hypothetical protein